MSRVLNCISISNCSKCSCQWQVNNCNILMVTCWTGLPVKLSVDAQFAYLASGSAMAHYFCRTACVCFGLPLDQWSAWVWAFPLSRFSCRNISLDDNAGNLSTLSQLTRLGTSHSKWFLKVPFGISLMFWFCVMVHAQGSLHKSLSFSCPWWHLAHAIDICNTGQTPLLY